MFSLKIIDQHTFYCFSAHNMFFGENPRAKSKNAKQKLPPHRWPWGHLKHNKLLFHMWRSAPEEELRLMKDPRRNCTPRFRERSVCFPFLSATPPYHHRPGLCLRPRPRLRRPDHYQGEARQDRMPPLPPTRALIPSYST